MATIEEVFASTMEIFKKQAQEALEAALSKAYEDYLPYVENDTYSNVRQQSVRWLERFMSDNLGEDDVIVDIAAKHGWTVQTVRNKMYEDNKEEIQKAIGVDLQNEIDSLKARLEDAFRRY